MLKKMNKVFTNPNMRYDEVFMKLKNENLSNEECQPITTVGEGKSFQIQNTIINAHQNHKWVMFLTR